MALLSDKQAWKETAIDKWVWFLSSSFDLFAVITGRSMMKTFDWV